MKDLRQLFVFMKAPLLKHKLSLLLLLIYGVFIISAQLAAPFLMGVFVNELGVGVDIGFLVFIAAAIALAKILERVFDIISAMLNTKTQELVRYTISENTIKCLHKAPISKLGSEYTSEIVQRIYNDAGSLSAFSVNFAVLFAGTFITLTIPLIYVFSLDTLFGVIVVLSLPAYFVIYSLFRQKVFKTSMDLQNANTEFFGLLDNQLFNVKFIKINNIGSRMLTKLSTFLSKLIKVSVKQIQVNVTFYSMGEFLGILLSAFLILYGGILVMRGTMSIGDIVTLSIYFPIIIGRLDFLLGVGADIQEMKVYTTRLTELNNIGEEANGDIQLDSIESIVCSDLNFSYGDNKVLDGFSYSFHPGKIYILLGENGKGKSTLINLILGLHVGEFTGCIKYNTHDINDVDMRYARKRQIGVSEQEPSLIADTIMFNMILDSGTGDISKINTLVDVLELREYIDSTENGFNTVINEDSSNLSGGQKQKISILKTLYKDPMLMVLDEPTSALDASSKEKLLNYLSTNKTGRITIIITHDKDFIDIADEIVEL